jgi:hypothetical protein
MRELKAAHKKIGAGATAKGRKRARQNDATAFYVDVRMQEWQMGEQPSRLQASVRKVLSKLSCTALLLLKDDRFEVMVRPEFCMSPWAYFPVHRRRLVFKHLQPKPQTRVLLVLSTAYPEQPATTFEGHLRDHLGHVLLYLRLPKAWNDCDNAWKEWRSHVEPMVDEHQSNITKRPLTRRSKIGANSTKHLYSS